MCARSEEGDKGVGGGEAYPLSTLSLLRPLLLWLDFNNINDNEINTISWELESSHGEYSQSEYFPCENNNIFE